ncbi:MAG: aminotransferase class III-fold pyridoxal phosphate-dependent enzyme, partial [Gemmatimonadetes bacterium]|nr:aminotransferase class III-fold pyridoxal phosphate-dependent enzyme [Gemmatimonadota bacterium]
MYPDPSSASARLFERACKVLPGGNTRTTVFLSPYPLYAVRGHGCQIIDAEGIERIDFLNNYTSLVHGHAHPAIVAAVREQLELGTCFPLPTESEILLAELLCDRVPSVERVRFTNSGSEAVMMAIKAARAFSGRPRIAKCEGAYHGSYDFVEVSLDASPEDWGEADHPRAVRYSKGTPDAVLSAVTVIPFNHVSAAERILSEHADTLAAVIVDPMPNRVGLIPATREFLSMLRRFTSEHGILLIFDEVITFRLGYEGAQQEFGVIPDMTTMGKIIGGGFPVGAV